MAKAGRGDDQYMLRFPPGLRDRIKAHAEKNGTSINTEIITLLEEKFPAPPPMDGKVHSLLKSLDALKNSSKSESIDRVVAQVVDTLELAALGRIADVPEDVRDDIRDALDDWNIEQAKAEELRAYDGGG